MHSSQKPNDLINHNNYLPHHEMFGAFRLLPKVGQTGFIPVNKKLDLRAVQLKNNNPGQNIITHQFINCFCHSLSGNVHVNKNIG